MGMGIALSFRSKVYYHSLQTAIGMIEDLVECLEIEEAFTWVDFERDVAFRSKAFVLVEGGLDRRVYLTILDDADRCIIITHPKMGRKEIEDAFPLDEVYGLRTLGIIDRDFDYAFPEHTYADGLLVTPTHDVETLVLSTPAFENLLDDYVDPSDRAAFESTCGVPIITAIRRTARPIGLLRLYNAQRFDLELRGMNFKPEGTGRIPYEDYVGTRDFALSLDGLIDWLFYNTDHPFFKKETDTEALKAAILAGVAELDAHYPVDWLVCQGHDLVGLIALGLKDHFGSRPDDLEDIIKKLGSQMANSAVLKPEYLHRCPLCDRIREWEDAHPPFRVLRDAARASSTPPPSVEESG